MCESIICSTEVDSWESVAEACISDNEKIAALGCLPEVLSISEKKELAMYPSALYYHSNREQQDD